MIHNKTRFKINILSRTAISSLAIAAMLVGPTGLSTAWAQGVGEAPAQTIDQAVDKGEGVTAYHAVQGYQLDTPDSSLSGARRVFIGRKRMGDKSVVMIDQGAGVQLSGINDDLVVMPYERSGRERDGYGFDWNDKTILGQSAFTAAFNALMTPRIRANRNRPRNATWTSTFDLSELSLGRVQGEDVTIRFTREFTQYDGKPYVLIGYEVPAFTYADQTGMPMVHWASGFVITDPAFSVLYYYGAKNMGTRAPMTSVAEPMSARVYTYATDETGNRLLDISGFSKAQALIDKAVEGGTDYAAASRAATPQPFLDNGFFSVARMIDMAGSAIGENSGNQAPQASNTAWQDTGTGATYVTQAKNTWNVIRNLAGYAGDEEYARQAEKLADITDDSFSLFDKYGASDYVKALGAQGQETFTELVEWVGREGNSIDDVYDWVDDIAKQSFRSDDKARTLSRLLGQNSEEISSTLKTLGVNSLEGIGKVLGPIAWAASGYTVYQAVDPSKGASGDRYVQTGQGSLVGGSSTNLVYQIGERVILDVGAGLFLDLATGDLIGFTVDGAAIVTKSFADVGRASAYYGNSLNDLQLSEATRLEILGNNYGRQKPSVDANLPGLLEADSNRTGQSWQWAVRNAETSSGTSAFERLRSQVPFDFEVVEIQDFDTLLSPILSTAGSSSTFPYVPTWSSTDQALSQEAIDKLNEYNFKMALMRFLQGRNPSIVEKPPGTTEIVDPPVEDGPGETTTPGDPEPDDPGPTGTVTGGTAPRDDGTGPTGSVTAGTTPAPRPPKPTPTPTPPPPTGSRTAETRFGETTITSARDSRILAEPRKGWYNNLAYDRDGNFLGYIALYPVRNAPPKPQPEPEEDQEAIDPDALGGTETGGIVLSGEPEDPAYDDPLSGDPLGGGSATGDIFTAGGDYGDVADILKEVVEDTYTDEEIQRALELFDKLEKEDLAAERRARGFSGTPLGEEYPNQVDYGDGSYPNQIQIDWRLWDPNANYPNPYSPNWKKWDPNANYPGQVKIDWKTWKPNGDYPNQAPNTFFQTKYDPDSFQKFVDQNAFKYANMSGFFPPNMAAYEDFITLYGLDYLDRLAQRAGYPNIWAALGDIDFLVWQSQDPRFIDAAMSFTCNVSWGVNYDCIGKNAQERAQLDLGQLLAESRGLFSDSGLSDVTINSRSLSYFLRDFGLEDGDIVDISVTQFGRTIFNGRTNLTNAGSTTNVNVFPGTASIEITAVNEGDVSPNTAEINIQNVIEGDSEQTFSLREGEVGTLKVSVQP